jgi:hypothetical protein
MKDRLRSYRAWFYAAAVYNLVWGVAVVAFPVTLAGLAGLERPGVYAIGYYLLARDPARYSGLIWIALAGKTLGPAGFVYYAATGILPWTFGWTCVFNDVIWWPVFWSFALRYGRKPLTPLP